MTANAQTGVVLSGGGANGAYEVGVMKALLNGASPSTGHQPIDPRIYTGTSTGAFNASVLTSQPGIPAPDAVARLEEIWMDQVAGTLCRCGNGVFRIRGLSEVIDPGCWTQPVRTLLTLGGDAAALGTLGLYKGIQFAASDANLQSRLLSLIDLQAFISEVPLSRLLGEVISLEGLRRSNKVLTVAATNWSKGTLRLFSGKEIANQAGTDAILASTAVPGIFAPVMIDGMLFVDGGVLMNTPFKAAIRAGARSLHVVFLDPLVDEIPLSSAPSTLDTFYHLFTILWASQVRNEVVRVNAINRTLDLVETEILEEVPTDSARNRQELGDFLEWGRKFIARKLTGVPYRKLSIHVYRPKSILGGGAGLLDFSYDRLEELIELGFQDAEEHDCEQAGCLLAEGDR